MSRLQAQLYASADPLDIAFRICAKGIEKWEKERLSALLKSKLGDDIKNYGSGKMTEYIVTHMLEELVIFIMDECDKKAKDTLQ